MIRSCLAVMLGLGAFHSVVGAESLGCYRPHDVVYSPQAQQRMSYDGDDLNMAWISVTPTTEIAAQAFAVARSLPRARGRRICFEGWTQFWGRHLFFNSVEVRDGFQDTFWDRISGARKSPNEGYPVRENHPADPQSRAMTFP